jgi:dephospho-CoA kinase
MLKIGLTGGIGSGKSTVAKIFETLGVPVYYADEEAKRLMNTDEELRSVIKKNFGAESYRNGQLDRKYLASIVFNDKYKLDLLNSLVHPATIRDAEQWMKKQTTPYVIKEAALLFEAGSTDRLDHVIGVFAPVEMRIKRVIDRDKVNRNEVLERMKRQIDEETKMKLCDFIITNDESQLLIPQVLNLHEQFLKTS